MGKARRAALLRHFGSMKRLRAAAADEIAQTDGIGPALAAQIYEALRAPPEGDSGEEAEQSVDPLEAVWGKRD